MKLLPKHIKNKLPKLGEQEHDIILYIKYFTPWTNWTWYVAEFDGSDIFFGLVIGFETELGYFSLSELESITGPFGLKIERDTSFTPTFLKDIE